MLSFKDFTDYCDLTEDGLRALHSGQPANGLGTNTPSKKTKNPQTPQQTLQYLRKYLDFVEGKKSK